MLLHAFSETAFMTEVRQLAGKGRCLFARRDFAAGDTVLREAPVLLCRPGDAPELLALLDRLH